MFIRRKLLNKILDHCHATTDLIELQTIKIAQLNTKVKKLESYINTQKLTKLG